MCRHGFFYVYMFPWIVCFYSTARLMVNIRLRLLVNNHLA